MKITIFVFVLTKVVSNNACVWLSFTIPGSRSICWHSDGHSKACPSGGASSANGDCEGVITIDTRLSTDSVDPGVLSILAPEVCPRGMGSGDSGVLPGFSLLRMSSDTGIKAN